MRANRKIERVNKRFDSATIEVAEEDAREIKPADIAEVEIRLERPVVVNRFTYIPEMNRFVLNRLGSPIAGRVMLYPNPPP